MTGLSCHGCGDPAPVYAVQWATTQGPQHGRFCRDCGHAVARRYPQTVWTIQPFVPVMGLECPDGV